MNLRDLSYLIAIAKHKHFGKAADACFISQPTLSAQLKKLEDELGVTLFERTNKQILTTPIGEQLVAQAQTILREVATMRELAKHTHNPLAGQFRLGIIPTLGPYLLPHILPAIKKHLPELELVLHEDKTWRILEELRNGKLDAIILAIPVPSEGFVVKQLFNESFFVALPNKHPLAHKKELQLKDLSNENLLLLEDGHCLRDQALEICQSVNMRENTGFHATSLETLRQMVATGSGVTLLPALAINKNSNITIKPISKQKAYRTIGMLWRKQSVREQCCNEITKIVTETMKKVLTDRNA